MRLPGSFLLALCGFGLLCASAPAGDLAPGVISGSDNLYNALWQPFTNLKDGLCVRKSLMNASEYPLLQAAGFSLKSITTTPGIDVGGKPAFDVAFDFESADGTKRGLGFSCSILP
jgi:hypothetical protein